MLAPNLTRNESVFYLLLLLIVFRPTLKIVVYTIMKHKLQYMYEIIYTFNILILKANNIL